MNREVAATFQQWTKRFLCSPLNHVFIHGLYMCDGMVSSIVETPMHKEVLNTCYLLSIIFFTNKNVYCSNTRKYPRLLYLGIIHNFFILSAST